MIGSEGVAALIQVTTLLEALDIPYLIGGSVASLTYGISRSTLDADLLVDLRLEDAEALVQVLQGSFYVDVEAIRSAIQHKSSFGLLHLDSMFKVDIFIPKHRPFDREQLNRRTLKAVPGDPKQTVWVCTAEDIILAKLEWFRLGGEVSERQWRDVLGVMKVQRDKLDMAYLRQWAAVLRVADLLDKALQAAD
jgi:hypothetical protein